MPTIALLKRKTLTLSHLVKSFLQSQAMALGWVDSHLDYTRFIVLCSGRTGSNMLLSLLNAHPQIIAFGELFNPQKIWWDTERYFFTRDPFALRLRRTQPLAFLKRKVFRRFPPSIATVGLKLGYNHAQQEPEKQIWAYLQAQPGLKVIHLQRRNLLKMYLSLQKAKLTQEWINLTGPRPDHLSLALDYQDCLEFFTRYQSQAQFYSAFFAQQPQLDVSYEALAADYEAQMRRVQAFLGVSYHPAQPVTYRQSSLPLAQAITNYRELKAQFAATPWAEFFEECS